MNTPSKVSDEAAGRLQENIEVHNRISRKYDKRHGEIFNDVEQRRLRDTLARSLAMVKSGSKPPSSLDFGCGSGNLTRHLLDLGACVLAADVSEGFLELVRQKFDTSSLSTYRLNGSNLAGLADARFDFIAAYSVLHHVPDYLGAVRELARVCKPGGVIYLDHEPTEGYWDENPEYSKFVSKVSRTDWKKFLVWRNYVGKIRRIFNPKYANEGDIHVWKDDHVEWPLIKETLLESGFEQVLSEDYLLFRRGYYVDVYEQYKDIFTDMRAMVFRKL